MAIGSVIHSALDKYWNDRDSAFNYVKKEIALLNLPPDVKITNVNLSLKNFYNHFSILLSNKDLVEKYFKIQYEKGVYLVGKFDRISNEKIFDWKTGFKVPNSIDSDIQFIFYYISYKRLYNKEPKGVYYVALPKGQMVKFTPRYEYLNHFENVLLPLVIKDIKEKRFAKEGLFTEACASCQFHSVCYKELWQDGT